MTCFCSPPHRFPINSDSASPGASTREPRLGKEIPTQRKLPGSAIACPAPHRARRLGARAADSPPRHLLGSDTGVPPHRAEAGRLQDDRTPGSGGDTGAGLAPAPRAEGPRASHTHGNAELLQLVLP